VNKPAPAPALRVEGVSKRFGSRPVFADVSFDAEPGTVVAIIGPSGGGKSTLLRCLNRLEQPDTGRVTVGGVHYDARHPLTPGDERELHRAVGMVFQDFRLFPHLTVLRNLGLAQQRVLGRSRAMADARSEELLRRFGLQTQTGSRVTELSGGQQQRLAIARALALEPELLLFDEPTSALDPETSHELVSIVQDVARSGQTVVVVSHEIRFVRAVADRIVVLADGHVVEQGPPERVLLEPATERTRRFLGSVSIGGLW